MAESGLKEAIEGLEKLKFAMILNIVLIVIIVVALIVAIFATVSARSPSPLLWRFFFWRLLPTPSGSRRWPTASFTRPSPGGIPTGGPSCFLWSWLAYL
jgi:hypothetical protein